MLALDGALSRPAPLVYAFPFVDGDPLADLHRRAREGDPRATTELVRRLAPVASRIVHSLAGRTPFHDDLVQEALVLFVRALGRFEGRSTVETYLYGICVNVVRHSERAGARLLRALEGMFRAREPQPAPAAPYREMRETERAAAIHRLLRRLPPKRREVLVLYEMEGRSAAEVAEILGIPEATVRTRLHHARRAFRRLAEKAPEIREDLDG
jgi:RNA polymerase sigma-70 factor (ECF subfamily)